MDGRGDAETSPTRSCCIENAFHFVNEAPVRGLQPSQRSHIRSHVMKRYRYSQRRSRQAGARNEGGGRRTAQDSVERAEPQGADDDSPSSASRTDDGMGLGAGGPREPRAVGESIYQSRQWDVPFGSSPSGSRGSSTLVSSTASAALRDELQPCCPVCGAPQSAWTISNDQRGMAKSAPAAAVWRRRPSSLVEPLGAGRVDPFRSYPVDGASPHVHELMDHTITYLLPGLAPDPSNGPVHPLSKVWLSWALEHPLLFHGLVFAGSIHLDFLRSSRIYPNKALTLSHKLSIIQELNKCMSDPNVALRDEVILAILILASHDSANESAGKENPFVSPLRSLQWLNIYSTLTYSPEHMKAVLELVMQRGGLENLNMYGLAEVLSDGIINSASNTLSKPFFPLLPSSEAWIDHATDWATAPPRPRVQELARGFLNLWDYGFTSEITQVFSLLGAVTMAINHYLQGEPGGLTLGAVAKIRTAAQHRILSLPPSVELDDPNIRTPHVYEASRIATMIYGIAVIWPVANAYNLLRDLATRLRASLVCFTEREDCDDRISDLVLWMLILGGVAAAADGPGRPWFVVRIACFAERHGIYRWETVEAIVRSFLWLESACSPGGKLLWSEVRVNICG